MENKAKHKGEIHDSAKHLSSIHYWGLMSGFELPTFVTDNHCALITVDAFEMENKLNPPYFQSTHKQHDIHLWILTPDILHMTKQSILFNLTVIWNIVVAMLTEVLSSLTGKGSDNKDIMTWSLWSCVCSGCYLAARLGPSFLWDLDRFCLSLGLLQSYPLCPVGRQSASGSPWACHWPSWASHGFFQPASSLCPAQLQKRAKDTESSRANSSCCETLQW